MVSHGYDAADARVRCQQIWQRHRHRQHRRWNKVILLNVTLTVLLLSSVMVMALDTTSSTISSGGNINTPISAGGDVSGCPPNYSGFSLKPNSSCTQYVLCTNGTPSSIMSCPTGLLYSGKIGEGGVCDWAATVVCAAEDDDEENEVVVASSSSAAGSGAVEVPAASKSTTAATKSTTTTAAATTTTATSTTKSSSSSSNNNSVINPNNFYCGASVEDASNSCLPCPGGTFEECNTDGSFSKGCFKGIVAKCNDEKDDETETTSTMTTPAATTTAAGTTTTSTGESEQDEDEVVTKLDENDEFNTEPSDYDINSNEIIENDESSSSLQPSLHPTLPPRPTLNPTLPPWTNAPFVPSPFSSSSNPKTIIGYYASWQWYDRNKFADPNNIDYSKYTRIHYAFFQPDEAGNLYGTDEWGDPQILWGPYVTTATSEGGGTTGSTRRKRRMSEGDNNYKCSWDGPNEKNCNYHELHLGLLHLARSAGVQVMPSIGGWTLSDNFPVIAADEKLREHFAKQCVELIVAYGFDGAYVVRLI